MSINTWIPPDMFGILDKGAHRAALRQKSVLHALY
jgi:hypothetical protein